MPPCSTRMPTGSEHNQHYNTPTPFSFSISTLLVSTENYTSWLTQLTTSNGRVPGGEGKYQKVLADIGSK